MFFSPRRHQTRLRLRPRLNLEQLEDRTVPAVSFLSLAQPAVGSSTADAGSVLNPGQGTSISQDGRYVVFQSQATNLVSGQTDTPGTWDVFVNDRVANTTTLVSHTSLSATGTGNGDSRDATISGDGRYIVFRSMATDLVANQSDANGTWDVVLHDRVTGLTTLVSHASSSATTTGAGESGSALFSTDGSRVVFASAAANLVAGQSDANNDFDVFLYDRATATNTLVSHSSSSATTAAAGFSTSPSVSADGLHVAFLSSARNLVVGQDDQGSLADVFLFDRVAGTTTLVSHSSVSVTTAGGGESSAPVISADGSTIAFASYAGDLVQNQNDFNLSPDLFLFNRVAGTTTLVSHNSGATTDSGDNFSDSPALSGDGRFVAFRSAASDLVPNQVDANGDIDIFLYDRDTGATTLVSHTAGSLTTAGDSFSDAPVIGGDGRLVAFASVATDLEAGLTDANNTLDVFVNDRVANTTLLLSHRADSETAAGNGMSEMPRLNGNARLIVFQSAADDLVSNDLNGATDVGAFALQNLPPTAEANGPYTVMEGGSVTLSAAGSSDAEQDANTLTYTWDLDGDGVFGETGAAATRGDETGPNPTFSAAGVPGPSTVTVALRVTDNGGLSTVDTAAIQVSNAPPTVDAGGPYSVVEGGGVIVAGSAGDPGGDALALQWDLDGDGVFGETGAAATHGDETGATPTFLAAGLNGPGTFTVSFRADDGDGGVTTTRVAVGVQNAAPSLNAGGPYSVPEGGSLTLNASATDPGGDTLTFTWDLNGNSVFGETGAAATRGDEQGSSPLFSAADLDGPSTITVQVRVNDGDGGVVTQPVVINIENAPPGVNTGEPYSVFEGGTLGLNATAIDPAGAGDSLTFTWDLNGNGVFGETGASATRGDETGATATFSAVGLDGPTTFTVSVRVDDGEGGVTTETAAIDVRNVAPVVDPGGPYSVPEGGSLTLTASATDPAGANDPLTYSWDLDSDGVFGETGAAATRGNEVGNRVTFAAAGLDGPRTFTVRVRVDDGDGGVTTKAAVIDVQNVAPSVTVGGPYTVVEGQTVGLSASATDPGGSSDPLTFAWDLNGNGVFGETGPAATHGDETGATPAFSALGVNGPGLYKVNVQVGDGDGGVTMQAVMIDVVNAPPAVDPGGPYAVVTGTTLRLNATATDPGGDTLTFAWDLDGDGFFGETGAAATRGDERGASPTFSAAGLAAPGTFAAALRVDDGDGGVVTVPVPVNIDVVAAPAPVNPPSSGGRALQKISAVSKVLKRAQTLVLVNLTTGRTFQIRLASRRVVGGVLVAVGDVNGDSIEDAIVVFRRKTGALKVFHGGTGQLLLSVPAGAFRKLTRSGGVALQLIDRDGDGDKEILLSGKASKKKTTLVFDGAEGRLVATL